MKRIFVLLYISAFAIVGTALALDKQTTGPMQRIDQARLMESIEQFRPTAPTIEITTIEQEKVTFVPGAYAHALSLIMDDLSKRGLHDANEIELIIHENSNVLIVSTKKGGFNYHGGLQYKVSRKDGHITQVGHWR